MTDAPDLRPVPRARDAPALAYGLAAFLVGNGAGELSLIRETRGAVLDWGGAYAEGVRLTGPWLLEDRPGPGPFPTDGAEVHQGPGTIRTRRTSGGVAIDEVIAAHPEQPRLLVRRRLTGPPTDLVPWTVSAEFSPMLAPVLVEGIRPNSFRLERSGDTVRFAYGAFAAALDSQPAPVSVAIDDVPWPGDRREGPVRTLRFVWSIPRRPDGSADLTIALSGGRAGRFPEGAVPASAGWAEAQEAAAGAWMARTPTLEVPDAPELEEGFRRAKAALHSLYTRPEAGFTGLVAGYPWYAALWCRDLGRMLPSVLWLGDAGWTAASLDTVFAYQAPHDLPILGATFGELPMQVSPGPVFLFGTSDTSLYFPGIVRRYLDLTGDAPGIRRWFDPLDRVLRWAQAKVDPSSGLFRHGGELAGIQNASSGERVRLGIDAPDTTIWDSADRRDHAVDLQLLYLDLLRDLGALGDCPGAPEHWRALGRRAPEVAGRIAPRYAWPEETYLFDSLRADGSPVRKLRPNALQWVGAGLLDPPTERALVARAGRPDLATPWGLRTLSATDPEYDPSAYHMGQVWPVATAWFVRAALRAGDPSAAVGPLLAWARAIAREGGWLNECYRGDRPEPYDSCFLLGFSVAPFLATIFEDLLGLRPEARARRLSLRPVVPLPWPKVTLRGLAFAGGTVDLGLSDGSVEVHWSGPGPLEVGSDVARLVLDGAGSGRLRLPGAEERS